MVRVSMKMVKTDPSTRAILGMVMRMKWVIATRLSPSKMTVDSKTLKTCDVDPSI